ncbi:hypothetical protein QQS21_008506 [Conoideocrella luteorostrata]|uniref:AB hydrolase-1 domain-containing protein n=1 Tax=Conoideocrella luteorostrata TaxID=1105319 RepID=A0AAJ0CIR4_9HYPO|nr:hypothetical protein QQS21_008506 [Conoideocrella luteorostrata]
MVAQATRRAIPHFGIIIRRYSTPSATRDSQILPLPDGRVLGFSESGISTGYPVLFFHGFPSSRLEANYIDGLARKQNLRVITPDRPGFGISTLQPNRRIMDWPADVKSLTAHLDLSRFAILGGSGGGPYALAYAKALPPETLSAVGLLASAPPWEAGTSDLMRTQKIAHHLSTNWPSTMRLFSDVLVATTRKVLSSTVGTFLVNKMLEKSNAAAVSKESSPKGNHAMKSSIDHQREQMLRALFEGFAQGAEGFVHEAKLLTHPWGIDFEGVAYDGIQIWHGSRDVNAPISMIRWMAKRLPWAELHEFDDTHFSLAQHLDRILGDLVTEEEKGISR